MNGKDVFRGMRYLDGKFIEQAEFGSFSAEAFAAELDGEEAKARRRMPRAFLLAAVIALLSLLVGCGIVYVLSMQDLKLGDQQVTQERWDESQGTMVYDPVNQQVLTFSGLKGTPNYEAAKEWYDFLRTYDPEHVLYYANKDSEDPWQAPEEYSLYNIYTPKMQEKIDEIAAKYGLRLQGKHVDAFNDDALLRYLGMAGVLLPEAKASADDFNVSYYDGGWFHTDMHMTLEEEPDWPYTFLCSVYYSSKDCFDSSVCQLNDTQDWQEWNYTTASGYDVLVIRSPSVWYSWAFCDRGDATITVRVETILEWFGDDGVTQVPMTDGQLKKVLDAIDFSIAPQPGDPALLEGPAASAQLSQTQNGYTVEIKELLTDGFRTTITLGVTAPEDVDLEQCFEDGQGGLQFSEVSFAGGGSSRSISGGMSHGDRADNDGKRNTTEYHIDLVERPKDGVAYEKGSRWNLYLEGLTFKSWNQELRQWDTLWETEGIWNFEVTMDQGDWQEIEFIGEPVATPAIYGWDVNGNDCYTDVTLTSLKLRAYGGYFTSTWDKGALDFANYKEQKAPMVVLKDGTTMELLGNFELADKGRMIPLEEVDHILLVDGTKLYPQR